MAPNFSDEQDEILVEEVAKHPSLWQFSHPQYKDQRVKDNVWAEVADKIGKPVVNDRCCPHTLELFPNYINGCLNSLTLNLQFPKDPEVAKVWINVCKRNDKINVENARICSIHFGTDDHEIDLKKQLLPDLYAGKPLKLKKTAVPSLHMPPNEVKSVDDCKKRWRNIKDTYDRKKTKKTSGAPPMKKGKKWALEDKLLFLEAIEEPPWPLSNVTAIIEEEEEIKFDVKPEQIESTEPPLSGNTESIESPKPDNTPQQHLHDSKISRTNRQEEIVAHLQKITAERNEAIKNFLSAEQEVDETDLFFQSIAKSVKKLPTDLRHRAKIETLSVIGKLEMETLNSHHPPPSRCHSSPTAESSSLSATGSTENGQSPTKHSVLKALREILNSYEH